MTIAGMSFGDLDADAAAKAAFVQTVTEIIATTVDVPTSDVVLTLSAGSVIVSFLITVSAADYATKLTALQDAIDTNSLQSNVGTNVSAIPSISAIATGILSVSASSETLSWSAAGNSTATVVDIMNATDTSLDLVMSFAELGRSAWIPATLSFAFCCGMCTVAVITKCISRIIRGCRAERAIQAERRPGAEPVADAADEEKPPDETWPGRPRSRTPMSRTVARWPEVDEEEEHPRQPTATAVPGFDIFLVRAAQSEMLPRG
jgi:hypothetical protein